MENKSVIFDLDGTLTDSGEGIIKSVQYAFRTLGMNVPPYDKLSVFIGPPLSETFPKFGVEKDRVDEAIEAFRKRYLVKGKFENKPYPGIEKLLAELNEAGCHLYVATSKAEPVALEILAKFDLTDYFVQIAGASMDRTRETKSAVISYLLSTHHIQAEDCIMVGDTAYDVTGAKENGIPCIGVSWGYGKSEDMLKAGAIGIADTMDQLKEKIIG